MKKNLFVIVLFLLANGSSFAQGTKKNITDNQREETIKNIEGTCMSGYIRPESTVKMNYEGKDISLLKHTWRAQWITHPTESVLDYAVFIFRRTFEIRKQPHQFIIHLSADNRYKLFVNGKQVAFGPAIGDIAHYRYDTINIAEYLRPHKNVIAVEVVNFGEYKRAAQQSFMTAFILQGDNENEVNIDTGIGTGWKVIKNQSYKAIPFSPKELHVYYCAGPGDLCKADVYPWGWQTTDFDDSAWQEPRLANIEFAVGRGFLYGSVWFLVPRKIPFMEIRRFPFRKIVKSSGISIPEDFLEAGRPLKIKAHCKISILFDNGMHTVAYPELSISGGKGSRIKITYAEALFKTMPSSSGNMIEGDYKGNRDEIEGKTIFGVYDMILPDGGSNRTFCPLWKRTYRYVQLDIETTDEELIINHYFSGFMGYPFTEKASFQSDNKMLANIWRTSWRTLRNCADESFQDCPYYEQLQYIGDTRLQSLISIYVSGDDRLMRKAIKQFDNSRLPEGLTQSRYPAHITQIINSYSLFWISMIHDYLYYRNDPDFIKQFLPGMAVVLDYFNRHIDHTDMIGALEWWNFVDWAPEFPNGIPPGADNGHSTLINLIYVYALQQAVDIFRYFNWSYEAEKYQHIALKIQNAVKTTSYDGAKGLFADVPGKESFSQHTNIFAILTNTVDKEQQQALADKILTLPYLIKTTLYFKFYLFRALQKTGRGDEYINQLRPWRKMLADGLTTFAETDNVSRSDCHAWSATPAFDLLHIVAGIYPAEPGFKKIIINPNLGSLTTLKAEMPHPLGKITVDLRIIANGSIAGKISLPDSTHGIFIWKNKKIQLVQGKQSIKL